MFNFSLKPNELKKFIEIIDLSKKLENLINLFKNEIFVLWNNPKSYTKIPSVDIKLVDFNDMLISIHHIEGEIVYIYLDFGTIEYMKSYRLNFDLSFENEMHTLSKYIGDPNRYWSTILDLNIDDFPVKYALNASWIKKEELLFLSQSSCGENEISMTLGYLPRLDSQFDLYNLEVPLDHQIFSDLIRSRYE